MLPLFLLLGLVVMASYANKSRSAPDAYRAGETADQIWNKYLGQHGGAPNGTATVPALGVGAPPSYDEARSSLPSSLASEFDAAMASPNGAKARALIDKIGLAQYPEAARLLLRKATTS